MADNEITAEQLRDISDYLIGVCDAEFHEDDELGVFRTYSGRGMYGRECIGMTLSTDGVAWEVAMNLMEALVRADVDSELVEAFKSAHTDSMGRDVIYYWPNIAVAEPEDGEDDTDED